MSVLDDDGISVRCAHKNKNTFGDCEWYEVVNLTGDRKVFDFKVPFF